MNNVILIGRLTRDPDVRYTQSQIAVARFNVAVNRPKDKNGEQKADFIETIAFGKTAEVIEKYFSKGSQIVVQGRIQNNNYEDKYGNMVYTYQVVADRIEFVGSKNDGQQNNGSPQNRGYEQSSMQGIPEGFSALEDDDMPF